MQQVMETTNTPVQENEDLLVVRDLKQYFPIKAGLMQRVVGNVKAVDGVTFTIKRGNTLGLVGESGCGKTTIGKTILRLNQKTSGDVIFDGVDIFGINHQQLRDLRPRMQIIFQDPYSSLSPRMPVSEIIGEAVREHNIVPENEFEDYLDDIMRSCGLQPYHKDRYPHEFSGGQRQRICIARALALNPDFVVCDEPVSALDVSIQAQIINTFVELQDRLGLAYLFIAHDLHVVHHMSRRIAVMYLGKIVETAPADQIIANPLHPYTQSLISAIPVADPKKARARHRIVLEGEVPSPLNMPSGCSFRTRCRYALDQCAVETPVLRELHPGHEVACFNPQEPA